MPEEDSELVRRFCQDGEIRAAEELCRRYETGLYNYLWQILRNTEDCQDALQTTFAKALRALPNYREENYFKSWLFRIGYNEAMNTIRHRKRFVSEMALVSEPRAEIGATSQPDASEAMEQTERIEALREALDTLPTQEREVVVLRLQEDIPFKEIARITNAPLGTVLARMHNAKKRLRSTLQHAL